MSYYDPYAAQMIGTYGSFDNYIQQTPKELKKLEKAAKKEAKSALKAAKKAAKLDNFSLYNTMAQSAFEQYF